jgi:hypothetical protein
MRSRARRMSDFPSSPSIHTVTSSILTVSLGIISCCSSSSFTFICMVFLVLHTIISIVAFISLICKAEAYHQGTLSKLLGSFEHNSDHSAFSQL